MLRSTTYEDSKAALFNAVVIPYMDYFSVLYGLERLAFMLNVQIRLSTFFLCVCVCVCVCVISFEVDSEALL